jgi:hypothetical protein
MIVSFIRCNVYREHCRWCDRFLKVTNQLCTNLMIAFNSYKSMMRKIWRFCRCFIIYTSIETEWRACWICSWWWWQQWWASCYDINDKKKSNIGYYYLGEIIFMNQPSENYKLIIKLNMKSFTFYWKFPLKENISVFILLYIFEKINHATMLIQSSPPICLLYRNYRLQSSWYWMDQHSELSNESRSRGET